MSCFVQLVSLSKSPSPPPPFFLKKKTVVTIFPSSSNMPAESYDTNKFRNLININLTGLFLCAKAAGVVMIEKFKDSAKCLDVNGGPHANGKPKASIIFIASMSGRIVNWPQEQCAYNASKAGVKHLATSLAAEWAKYNIRVSKYSSC